MIRRIRAGHLRLVAVDLDPDLDAVVPREGAALRERPADLLERLLLGHVLRQPVRPHLDPPRPDVLREEDPLAAVLDVLPHDGRVGRVELADRCRGSSAGGPRPRTSSSRPPARPASSVRSTPWAWVVRNSTPSKPASRHEAQDRVEVPVLRDVVGHEAEVEAPGRARPRAPRASAPAEASPIRTTSRRVRTMVPPRVGRIVSPAPRPVQM